MIILIRLTITLFLTAAVTIYGHAAEIWVATNGSATNPGSKERPLPDLILALRKARELRRLNDASVAGGITIILRGGTYYLSEPLIVRPEDSGTADSPTIIKSAPGELAVLSGGIQLGKWKKMSHSPLGLPVNGLDKIWETEAISTGNDILDFRQLWVNGVKAVRAKDAPGDTMNRILSWNHKDQTCWIPKPRQDVRNVQGMEMLIHQWWAIANLRIKEVEIRGDSARLHFRQPESRIQSEHPWPAPWISKETGNSAFYLSNAIQFLDEPGEWFLDKKAGKIYFWPREEERMQNAGAVIPALETLLRIEGTIDHPVSNVYFDGISFQHSTWMRPSQEGHVPHQAGMYMLDAYKLKIPGTLDKKTLENQAWVGRPAAAVKASYTSNTGFLNCRFEHLASTGLDYHRGNLNDRIEGNSFMDIGGSAVLAGVFSDEAHEVHLPYDPSDERDITTNLRISNNLVSNVANEDWGCIGIAAGFVRDITISHNDISEVPYTGISMGWGWTRTINAMRNNRIIANKIQRYGKHMYDVAAIYTLSAQPGSLIADNYVDSIYKAPYAHDPNHWFYLYTDEGSSYFSVRNNWTPSDKYLQNANGPGNVWEGNGPQVADSIKLRAGLQPAFRHLKSTRTPWDATREINHSERKKVVELVAPAGSVHNIAEVQSLLKREGIDKASVYQWNNHTIVYGAIEDPEGLRAELVKEFSGSYGKIYNAPFYEFNRKKNCNQTTVAEWENILLTANLVKDSVLQNEYLDYHKRQFKDWPEVSNGFCNANFQQLQVFKNGRQLMLVISIPKGESLDKLNPKTTENNPRVDDWNNLMKKYQEGIEGTKPGETWVFLKPTSQ